MKIGIYTGTIPPPVFIEHLINGLAEKENKIFIYGKPERGYCISSNYKIIHRKISTTTLGILFYSLYFFIRLLISRSYSCITIIKFILQNSFGVIHFFQRFCRVLPPFLDDLDIFHIQWAKTLVYYPEFIEKLQCPIVLSLRGAQINYSPIADNNLAQLYKKFFPKVSGFHAVSTAISLEAQKYGTDQKKITIIYPAVNINLISDITKKRIIKTEDKLEIISVGRCHWKKGYTFALDVMATLMKKSVNFHYTIIAAGQDDENFLYQINDLGLTKNVTFINGLPHKKVIEMVSNSILFFLPSVEEGISNAVLEALALGTPVISTDCGGMSEVIQNGDNGFIVPVRDVNATVRTIQNFIRLRDKEKLHIIQSARETIEKRFLLSDQIDKMELFYQNSMESF